MSLCVKSLNVRFTLQFLSSCWRGHTHFLESRLFKSKLMSSFRFALWCFIMMCYRHLQKLHAGCVYWPDVFSNVDMLKHGPSWRTPEDTLFSLPAGNFFCSNFSFLLSLWNSFPKLGPQLQSSSLSHEIIHLFFFLKQILSVSVCCSICLSNLLLCSLEGTETFWVVSYTSCTLLQSSKALLIWAKLICDGESSLTSMILYRGWIWSTVFPGDHSRHKMYVCAQSEVGRRIQGKVLQRLFQDNSKSYTHCCAAQNTLKENKKNEGTCNSAHFSS